MSQNILFANGEDKQTYNNTKDSTNNARILHTMGMDEVQPSFVQTEKYSRNNSV